MLNRLNKYMFIAILLAMPMFMLYTPKTHAQPTDFTRVYRYGGSVHVPGSPFGGGGGTINREIINVNTGVDVGGVLGCSGLDLRGMLQNVFDVGDIGSELKGYLKNRLATEALSLLYSQPAVSEVLNGMQALANARVSIQQERCNANEILADATNQRLRSEAQELCLREKSPAECEGSTLGDYVKKVAGSRRWSGDLHSHICPEDPETGERSPLCRFVPNFTYDVGARVGRQQPASYSNDRLLSYSRGAALDCLQERGERVTALVREHGYTEAFRRTASGQSAIHCGEAAPPTTPTGPITPRERPNDPVVAAAQGITTKACTLSVPGADGEPPLEIDVNDLNAAIAQAEGVNEEELIQKHVQCIIGREIHPHVDQRIASLPALDALGAWNALAEVFSLQAFANLKTALINTLVQTIINSGGESNSRNCSPEEEEAGTCQPSLNKQSLDHIRALIDQYRGQVADALNQLEIKRRIADVINNTLEEQEERTEKGRIKSSRPLRTAVEAVNTQSNIRPDLR